MLERFYKWLAEGLTPYIHGAETELVTGLIEPHPAWEPGAPEWQREDGVVKTSPGVAYTVFRSEKSLILQGYLDFSNLLAIDEIIVSFNIRLKEGEEFKPYLIQRLTGAPPRREPKKQPLSKMTIFRIPEIRAPAGLELTIEQTVGVSRGLYYLLYSKSPDVL